MRARGGQSGGAALATTPHVHDLARTFPEPTDMRYEYVESTDDLQRLLAAVESQPVLAVDTEAAGYHRYLDRISLLQISVGGDVADGPAAAENFLVDPLAIEDLSALRPVFADRAVTKIFHDADYDLRILHRDLEITVAGLFDTQTAAAFLGERSLGLGTIVERYLGVHLPKAFQRADWAERPLSEGMREYAATDTAYLGALRERLTEELHLRGRMHWAEEEFLRREQTRWTENEDAREAFMRIKGARDLPPRGLAVLRELFAWRESVAAERDQAPFRILSNQALLEMSVRPPTSAQGLRATSGVSDGLVRHRGRDIMAAVSRGMELPDSQLPRFPIAKRWDRDPEVEVRAERLRDARTRVAQQLDLDAGFLMPRAMLDEIARRNPASPEELREVPDLRAWQLEILGDALLRELR
jgi:ribonuclease D